jgi:hypothetical protein
MSDEPDESWTIVLEIILGTTLVLGLVGVLVIVMMN